MTIEICRAVVTNIWEDGFDGGADGAKPVGWIDDIDTGSSGALLTFTAVNSIARITRTATDTVGIVLSPTQTVDVGIYPNMQIVVTAVSAAAQWQLVVQEQEGAFRTIVLTPLTSEATTICANFADELGWTEGSHSFSLQLTVEGAIAEYVEIDFASVFFFQDDIEQTKDYDTNFLTLLLQQYKDSPNLIDLIEVGGVQANAEEEAAFEILYLYWLDTATGIQLDTVGSIFNVLRDGLGDELYRRGIRSRSNLSASGTPEEIINILKIVFSATFVEYDISPPAAFVVNTDADVTDAQLEVFSPAGVGVNVIVVISNATPFAVNEYVDNPGEVSGGFDDIFNPSATAGIYITLRGFTVGTKVDELIYDSDPILAPLSLGTSLLGVGADDLTNVFLQFGSGAATVEDVGGEKTIDVSATSWGSYAINAVPVTQKNFYYRLVPKALAGGRWLVLYHYTAFGGFSIQHIPGSELRIMRFVDGGGNWDFITSSTIVKDWDIFAPAGIPNLVEIRMESDVMTLTIDGVVIGSYTDATFNQGTIALGCLGSGWRSNGHKILDFD